MDNPVTRGGEHVYLYREHRHSTPYHDHIGRIFDRLGCGQLGEDSFRPLAEVRIARTDQLEERELQAAFHGLRALASREQSTTIRMEMDNRTAVAFANRQGGTMSRWLCQIALEMWKWAAEQDLILTAVHVPSKDNTTTDRLSWLTSATEYWSF